MTDSYTILSILRSESTAIT